MVYLLFLFLFLINLSLLLIKLRKCAVSGLGVVWENYPTAAANFIQQRLPGAKVINPYEWGGFLSWQLPDNLIFIDGRQLPGQKVFNECDIIYRYPFSDFQVNTLNNAARNYGAEAVIYPLEAVRGQNIWRLFPVSDWALVYFDRAALIYLPRRQNNQTLIASWEYQLVNPLDVSQNFYQRALEDKNLGESMAQELKRALNDDPANRFVLIPLANYYFYQQDWFNVAAVLQKALASNPASGRTWAQLGLVYQQLGKSDEAAACFRKAESQGYKFEPKQRGYLLAGFYEE